MADKISATLKSKIILEEYHKQNITIYNFGLGENPIEQPPYYIEKVKEYAHKKQYASCTGILELNATLQNIYNTVDTQYNIIVGNGLKELIFILQMAFEGTLIHITPSWISYKEQTNILPDKHVIDFETCIDDEFSVCLEKLDALLETMNNSYKLLLFNNPNNPTGVVYQNDELRAIANILKKHQCLVFADEIYLHLCHEQNIQSISSFIPELTIIGSSVSKDLGCGGYRLGWLAFPQQTSELYYKCAQYSSNIFSCASVPIQYATNYMLSNTDLYKQHYSETNSIFSYISREMYNILCGSKLKFVKPNSAWYIVIDFGRYTEALKQLQIHNSIELSNYLLEKLQILTVAGQHFALKGLCLRLSFVDFTYSIGQNDPLDISKMRIGMNKIVHFVKELDE